jgi:hypothetical protein
MHSETSARTCRGRLGRALALGVAVACCGCADPQRTKGPAAIAYSALPMDERIDHWARSDHVALLEHCLSHYQQTCEDFTCQFFKQERIGGKLRPEEGVNVKFRESPFSVAFAWFKNTPSADRLIYVEGRHGGKMLVRPSGAWLAAMVGTVTLAPTDPKAMRETLRPVTQFGFRRALESLLSEYRQAHKAGDVECAFGGYYTVDGRRAVQLVRTLPNKPGYPAKKTEIYIDLKHLVPTCIRSYDWQDRLLARYMYKSVAFNQGLTDCDFRPESNDMRAIK